MSKIVLISCSSKKLNRRAKAEDLYISPLFQKSLRYAKCLKPDKIFVLSAKHHLLHLSKVISPYNLTLNDMYTDEIKKWSDIVLQQLRKVSDLNKDNFIFIAGSTYLEYIIPQIKYYEIPMENMRIGEQLEGLTDELKICDECALLHQLFKTLPKFSLPFKKVSIPNNGIYILFEKGEVAHGTNRIVRVGTHTGLNQLHSRLIEHFLTKNKDRSIFRKNIGRAILNKRRDPFIIQWEKDLTSKKAREEHAKSIDFKKQNRIEKIVSRFIQSYFSFVVFPIADEEERLDLESKIISTVSLCNECQPSDNWLGLHSTVNNIRKSGLWLKQGLWKTPLSKTDIKMLKHVVNRSL